MTKVEELKIMTGSVAYHFDFQMNDTSLNNELSEENELAMMERFDSLNELLALTNPSKLVEMEKKHRAKRVRVDAICLNAKNEDKTVSVETLLMIDGNYVELMRRD